MADPRIWLTACLPNNVQPAVGELILSDPTTQGNVVLIRGRLSELPHGIRLDRFVDMRVRIASGMEVQRSWGTALVELSELVQVSVTRQSILTLMWYLGPTDLAAIETERAGGRYVTFNIVIEALGVVTVESAAELHPIRGQGQLQLSITEWEDRVLTPLGYKLPPTWERLIPIPGHRPEWTSAEERLDAARKFLRRGEGRDALGAALDAFETIVSGPYNAAQWKAKLKTIPEENLPEQKRDALAEMIGGLCGYLNRVGHHRARQAPAAIGPLSAMPVDQWEVEHVIAAVHFLLALALRLDDMARQAAGASPAEGAGASR